MTLTSIPLGGGVRLPRLAIGVGRVSPDAAAGAVRAALAAGYRGVDSTAAYDNENGVAQGIRESGVAREDIVVTAKLPPQAQGAGVVEAFERSVEALGLHPDIYLIDWPVPAGNRYVETWSALVDLREAGQVGAIGVANFEVAHLRRLIDETGIVPAVNQVELHPWLPQTVLREFHDEHGIATQASTPLATGALLGERSLAALAAKYGTTVEQIVLCWQLQLGNAAVPTPTTPARILELLDVAGFELAEDDLLTLADLDRGERIGPDPDDYEGERSVSR